MPSTAVGAGSGGRGAVSGEMRYIGMWICRRTGRAEVRVYATEEQITHRAGAEETLGVPGAAILVERGAQLTQV